MKGVPRDDAWQVLTEHTIAVHADGSPTEQHYCLGRSCDWITERDGNRVGQRSDAALHQADALHAAGVLDADGYRAGVLVAVDYLEAHAARAARAMSGATHRALLQGQDAQGPDYWRWSGHRDAARDAAAALRAALADGTLTAPPQAGDTALHPTTEETR